MASGGQWPENAQVFVPDDEDAYILVTVVSCRGFGPQAELIVKRANGATQKVPPALLEQVAESDPLAIAGADDMVKFASLTEATLLHNLRVRYARDSIYSAAGSILISVNPFKKVSLYTQELMQKCKVPLASPIHAPVPPSSHPAPPLPPSPPSPPYPAPHHTTTICTTTATYHS